MCLMMGLVPPLIRIDLRHNALNHTAIGMEVAPASVIAHPGLVAWASNPASPAPKPWAVRFMDEATPIP